MIFDAISDFLRVLTGESRQRLNPLQLRVINAVLSTFPAHQRHLVELQLEQQYYVSYWHHGKINPIFFKNLKDLFIIKEIEFQDILFKVQLFIGDKKHSANVNFYKGRIFSIEFDMPYNFFKNKEVIIGKIEKCSSKESYTNIIDQSEHGLKADFNP